jgi:hypothetical protein
MATLSEIEAAADALPRDQKQALLLFLAARLRAEDGLLPTPRDFPLERMQTWIDEDDADMKRLRDDKAA